MSDEIRRIRVLMAVIGETVELHEPGEDPRQWKVVALEPDPAAVWRYDYGDIGDPYDPPEVIPDSYIAVLVPPS